MSELEALRPELEALDARPLDERPALFERVHAALVAELAALEEA